MNTPVKSSSQSLSLTSSQKLILEKLFVNGHGMPSFEENLQKCGSFPLRPVRPGILQMNLGYRCNQTCVHCHVDAGPHRREMMTLETMKDCLQALKSGKFNTLDITGGAPELHPEFRWLVGEASKISVSEIIVRSNLTILVANPSYYDLPDFFAQNKVRICSSLPFYTASRTDRQRGEGVFEKSIRALRMLNHAGYGRPTSGLILDLIYNPSGAFLPGNQSELEAEFKKVLEEKCQVVFNRLLAITNVPISRFLEFLIRTDNLESYMEKLVTSFNSQTINGLMCRETLSVDWQGYTYDCDFNQMLGLKQLSEQPHIRNFEPDKFLNRDIVTGSHCYACTAGKGSSCQGNTI